MDLTFDPVISLLEMGHLWFPLQWQECLSHTERSALETVADLHLDASEFTMTSDKYEVLNENLVYSPE